MMVMWYLRSIENLDDLGDDWVVFVFMLLADKLDVSQFAEVEIPLLFQAVHGQLQLHQLQRVPTALDKLNRLW